MPHYLSKERLAELKQEYEYLTKQKRREIAARLQRAKEFGDLSENAEYNEAKDEQGQIERRISELNNLFKNCQVIKKSKDKSIIGLGSSVVIERAGGPVITYEIVGAQEADPDKGKISNESPVGAALLGRAPGEQITVETLNGTVKYTIKEVN